MSFVNGAMEMKVWLFVKVVITILITSLMMEAVMRQSGQEWIQNHFTAKFRNEFVSYQV